MKLCTTPSTSFQGQILAEETLKQNWLRPWAISHWFKSAVVRGYTGANENKTQVIWWCRGLCVLQTSPELLIWTNHIVCLLSFPFILTLESTVLLSMNCVLYCYVCINSAQALTRLSILCLYFAGDNPGGLAVRVRCCFVIAIVGYRCKATGVTGPVLERRTPALQNPQHGCC